MNWPLQGGFNKSKVYGLAQSQDKEPWPIARGGHCFNKSKLKCMDWHTVRTKIPGIVERWSL